MRSSCGKHKQLVYSEVVRLAFNVFKQFLATSSILVIRMDRQTAQFAYTLLGKGVEGSTGDRSSITLQYREMFDLHLQQFTGATYQYPLTLQRFNQFQYSADIIDRGLAYVLEQIGADQGAYTVTGKEFQQQTGIAITPAMNDEGLLQPLANRCNPTGPGWTDRWTSFFSP